MNNEISGIIEPGPKRTVTLSTSKGHQVEIENKSRLKWELDEHGVLKFSAVPEFQIFSIEVWGKMEFFTNV